MTFKNNKTGTAIPVHSATDITKQKEEQDLKENLGKIKHKIVVLSGKGGVGKSTVAVNLAVSLAEKKFRVGLLDVDIHGPSVPKLLGLEKNKLSADENEKLLPAVYSDHLKVVSVGFLIDDEKDPVVWRGPLKYGIIKQFLKDVAWGELDYLIIDSPPGTGDEPLSVCQLIEDAAGAVVVTTPQDVALIDVKKSITFCHKLNMPVLGVVENMSGFTCPHCGKTVDIFKKGGGKSMSEEMNVPFLGAIPIDISIAHGGDAGKPEILANPEKTTGKAFTEILNNILKNISK
ncbi:MAG: ATP-binding protein [Spirochaetae bacterium HGW-Spirochaetae-1]|jgi:Mrp family chromosome partitioning ATPase|nr:MAG: ATP-binding protein [Spirochaetae bacterium HGW-Spirochaetae-1]